MKKHSFDLERRLKLLGPIVLAALLGGLIVQQVRAAGIPQTGALTYTGRLVDSSGAPVDGDRSIGIAVFDVATGGEALCAAEPGDVVVTAGHFQVPLPDACQDVVKAQPDLWLEASVEGEALARVKLGAVPFAVEAGHASTADRVAGPQSGFRATLTVATQVPGNAATDVAFDKIVFDLGQEFDAATGAFVPKSAGYYFVQCALGYAPPSTLPTSVGQFEAIVAVDGVAVASVHGYGGGVTLTRSVSVFINVDAGSEVTCQGNHPGDMPVYLREAPDLTHFEAARIASSE